MSKKTLADQEVKIKDSLFEFVKSHIQNADLSLIDDIVLSYVIAILEDVSSDPVFDVEDFCEMMSAYFPEFESINHATICEWIFELEAKLRRVDDGSSTASVAGALIADGGAASLDNGEKHVIEIQLPEIVPKLKTNKSTDLSNGEMGMEAPKRVHKLSEMSDGGGSTDSSCCDFLDEIDVLQEMFPHVCSIEVAVEELAPQINK